MLGQGSGFQAGFFRPDLRHQGFCFLIGSLLVVKRLNQFVLSCNNAALNHCGGLRSSQHPPDAGRSAVCFLPDRYAGGPEARHRAGAEFQRQVSGQHLRLHVGAAIALLPSGSYAPACGDLARRADHAYLSIWKQYGIILTGRSGRRFCSAGTDKTGRRHPGPRPVREQDLSDHRQKQSAGKEETRLRG